MTRPSILVDGLVFENNYQIGIWRVFYEILNRISKKAQVTLLLRAPAVQPLPEVHRIIQDSARVTCGRWRFPNRLKRLIYSQDAKIRKEKLPPNTIFHSTYFTACPFPEMPQVTTVFDMIAETNFPIMGGWTSQNSLAKSREIEKATKIITISHSAATDLRLFYPKCSHRIAAIQLGGDHLMEHISNQEPVNQKADYALFVGTRGAYKNFHTVLHAMRIPEWPKTLKLHVVGSPFSSEEMRFINALGLENRITNFGWLTDEDLRQQYRTALCFIFPSLAEGFGLPILEAQVNGCPVVCSDIAVFREVAGDAAIYFDPRLAESLATTVASYHENRSPSDLVQLGRNNARKFTWDRTAEETLTVYVNCAMD